MRRDEFLPPKADCHGGELDRAKREREGSHRAIIPELGKNTATGGEMTARQPRPSSGASPESLACRVYRITATRQQRQDWLFHQLTRLFSWVVLLALVGIIVSLVINAMPAFNKFGLEFIWRDEWDIINEEFGAAIAVFGTLASASIALLIAVPLSFEIGRAHV